MARTGSFYSQEVVQVRKTPWPQGRVVLAGAINRHAQDLPRALAEYETTLQPFVDEIQAQVKPRLLHLGMPRNRWAIGAFHSVTALACLLHIPDLVARYSKEDRGGDWQLLECRRPAARSSHSSQLSRRQLSGTLSSCTRTAIR